MRISLITLGILLLLSWNNRINGQHFVNMISLTSEQNQIEKISYSNGTPDEYNIAFYNYDYTEQYHPYPVEEPYYSYHTSVTFYAIDLSWIPTEAYNITARVRAYRSGGNGDSDFLTALDGVYYNDADKFNSVDNGSVLFTVDHNNNVYHDITGLLNQKITQGYINFGVYPQGVESGFVSADMIVEWDMPLEFVVKNKFEFGTIKVGIDQTPSITNSPDTITVNMNQNVNIEAVDQQYGAYDWIWNSSGVSTITSIAYQRAWKRNKNPCKRI